MISKEEELLICNKAINTFGQAIQKVVAMEECSELIQAISKSLRGKEDTTNNIEEEIADVEIMLQQLKIMYNADKVEEFRDKKLKRLKGNVW